MNPDKYSNPIFTEEDIFELLYQGQFQNLDQLFVKDSKEIQKLELESGITFKKPSDNFYNLDVEDFDKILQSDWFMPEEYKTTDIEAYCIARCNSIEQQTRVFEELEEYKKRSMLDLLRWLKYFVDTCRANNILWGVGRGSSVASYVLFIIGVHKIDSIKYNLDWHEFLR
jgi:DNA polymerase III alpha subunit